MRQRFSETEEKEADQLVRALPLNICVCGHEDYQHWSGGNRDCLIHHCQCPEFVRKPKLIISESKARNRSTAMNARKSFTKKQEQAERSVDEWNRDNRIGTEVLVTKDDGSEIETKTRSQAFVASDGIAVIHVHGISGYYMLSRVRRLAGLETNPFASRYDAMD